MTIPETKSVAYSYPTSPNADRFGFRNGCWTVEIIGANHMPRSVRAFATEAEAIENASKIDLPWNPLYLRFHQGNCER